MIKTIGIFGMKQSGKTTLAKELTPRMRSLARAYGSETAQKHLSALVCGGAVLASSGGGGCNGV